MQKELAFPPPKIVTTPKVLLRARIAYSQVYYIEDRDADLWPTPERKHITEEVILGVVDSEEDGREVISRIDPAKDFFKYAWTFDKAEYYFQPVSSYEVTNESSV